jgi:hypothetical protein
MSGRPLNETPKERLDRVAGGKKPRFAIPRSPTLLLVGIGAMVLAIVLVGVIIALSLSGMLTPYFDAILNPLGG